MTTTATVIAPPLESFPFIGIGPASQHPITAIPSAEVTFAIFSAGGRVDDITIAAAGEDQTVTVNCDLPRSFSYVLVEAYARIQGADGDEWDTEGFSNLNSSITSPDIVYPINFGGRPGVGHSNPTNESRFYEVSAPGVVLIPTGPDDARFTTTWSNVTIDGSAMTISFFARFLRYDRNQVQFWQVNTPVLVR